MFDNGGNMHVSRKLHVFINPIFNVDAQRRICKSMLDNGNIT